MDNTTAGALIMLWLAGNIPLVVRMANDNDLKREGEGTMRWAMLSMAVLVGILAIWKL